MLVEGMKMSGLRRGCSDELEKNALFIKRLQKSFAGKMTPPKFELLVRESRKLRGPYIQRFAAISKILGNAQI